MSITLTLIRPQDVQPGVALGDRLVTRVNHEPTFKLVELELSGRGASVTLSEDDKLILIEGDGPWDKLVRDWPTDPHPRVDRDYSKRMETYRRKNAEEEKYSVAAARKAATSGTT